MTKDEPLQTLYNVRQANTSTKSIRDAGHFDERSQLVKILCSASRNKFIPVQSPDETLPSPYRPARCFSFRLRLCAGCGLCPFGGCEYRRGKDTVAANPRRPIGHRIDRADVVRRRHGLCVVAAQEQVHAPRRVAAHVHPCAIGVVCGATSANRNGDLYRLQRAAGLEAIPRLARARSGDRFGEWNISGHPH